MRLRTSAFLALCAAFTVASCDDPVDPGAESAVFSIVLDTTNIGLVWQATVVMKEPGPVRVSWEAPNAPTLVITADSNSYMHRVLLTRLRQGQHYTVRASGVEQNARAVRDTFTTDSLPPALRAMQINQIGTPSYPIALLEVVGATNFSGLLVVEQSQIVGWLPMASSLFGATRRANGNVIMLDAALGLTEYTLGGVLAHRLPQPEAGAPTAYGRIHHDVLATPANTALFIAMETQVVGADTVVGESIWEWTPETGAAVKRFSVFDFLNWNTLRGSRSVPGNWLHGNGLSLGPRGNVLMSMRNADQVMSIAPDFQSVEWTLGGTDGTLGISAADRFWGQHYVSEPSPGHVLIFDNGFERPGGSFSRAIEFQVDVANDTVTKVWEYRNSPEIYAALVGSARRLPNGNTSIMFGMFAGANGSTGPVTAVEVTPAGVPVWRLTFSAQINRLYRVLQISSLLGEVQVFGID